MFVKDKLTVGLPATVYDITGSDTRRVASAALGTQRLPAPANQTDSPVEFVPAIIADLISAGVQLGCNWIRRAAVPLTCGAAIDVPLNHL